MATTIQVRVCNVAGAALVAATLLGTGEARGQCTEIGSFRSSTAGNSQGFGSSMSENSDRLVVGAPTDSTKASSAGTAYVFEWDASAATWVEKQQLFASDPLALDQFGGSVAIKGDVLLIGSPFNDTVRGVDAGAVYVFRRNPTTNLWSQEQKLIPNTGAGNDQFGKSVAVSGTVAVIGAPNSDAIAADAGAAFVFRDRGGFLHWLEETKLLDSNGASQDHAGVSVAYDGTTAYVGSDGADASPLFDLGVVSLWGNSGTTWTQGPDLAASDQASFSNFGAALALDGDALIVGAPGREEGGLTDAGVAYIFRNVASNWTEETKLVPPAAGSFNYWGRAVGLRGGIAVVASAVENDGGLNDCGKVCLFRKLDNSWYTDHIAMQSDRLAGDKLGTSAVVTAHEVLAGAPFHSTTSTSFNFVGAVYRFHTPEIIMEIKPPHPAPGAAVTFGARSGNPGDPVMMVITSVNGSPTFLLLILFVFQSDDALTIPGNAPPVPLGVHVGMTSFKFGVKGNIVQSAETFVDL